MFGQLPLDLQPRSEDLILRILRGQIMTHWLGMKKASICEVTNFSAEVVMPTILIVDKDLDTRCILRLALEAHGFTVLEAADATAGLHLAEHCDAVVLNYPIEFGDGSTLTARLRASEKCHSLPIINLTSHALRHEIESATRDGVSVTITKPHSVSFIERELRSLLAQG